MRRVARTRRVVQEERLLRRDHLRVLDELKRLISQIHGQVIPLRRRARRIDRMAVVHQIGIPLIRLRAEEPVEALKATASRPIAPRGGEVHLGVRAQMPLADHVRVPAALPEDLLDLPVLRRDHPARVREPDRRLGDTRHAVARVIAPRQQARARRRAQRRRVHLRIAHSVRDDPLDVWRRNRAAVAAQRRVAHVVEHDVQNIRRPIGRLRRLKRRPIRNRIANVDVDNALE